MSTIWRPNLGRLRVGVAEMEDRRAKRGEGCDEKGVAEEPLTKGPCEHGVKPRSHTGLQRLSARKRPFGQGVRRV